MVVLKSHIFSEIPDLEFGFSTKIGLNRKAPFFFNMSLTVNDIKEIVIENRSAFFNYFGLSYNEVALQKQIHSDIISYVNEPGMIGESDAMITGKPGIGLAISTADCTPVFIYDRQNKIIAGIHSGWRGTEKKIVKKTLERLFNEFNSSPDNLFIYVGPSISQRNYEVGADVASHFDNKYLKPKDNDKFLLDVSRANYDMIIESGVPEKNIEKSLLCSFEMKDFLHSYRRDGVDSGRALGVIVLKEKNAK